MALISNFVQSQFIFLLICRMSEQDVGNQKFLYSWIVPLIFVGSIYLLLKKYGGYLKDR